MVHRPTVLLVVCATCLGSTLLLNHRWAMGFTPEQDTSHSTVGQASHIPGSPQQRDAGFRFLTLAQADSSTSLSQKRSVLKLGSRGQQVSEVQALLKKLGHYSGSVDGVYGDRTRLAAIAFQAKQPDLPVDGQIGSTTLTRLQSIAASTPTPAPASLPFTNAAPTPDLAIASANEGNSSLPPANAKRDRRWLWGVAGGLAIAVGTGFILTKLQRLSIKRLPAKAPLSGVDSLEPSSAKAETTDSFTANEVDRQNPQPLSQDPHSPEVAVSPGTITPISETTRLPKTNIVGELIGDLHSIEPAKRRRAIWELGQVGDSNAIDPLIELMMDSDSSQRSLILASISEIGIRTLKPLNRALLLSMQDRSPEVRKNAIRDITRVYDLMGQMSELLAHAATDSDEEVRDTAHWALGQLNRIRPVPEMGNGNSLPANSVKPPDQLSGDASVP